MTHICDGCFKAPTFKDTDRCLHCIAKIIPALEQAIQTEARSAADWQKDIVAIQWGLNIFAKMPLAEDWTIATRDHLVVLMTRQLENKTQAAATCAERSNRLIQRLAELKGL